MSLTPRGTTTVLLVEDHEDSRQMYAEFLRLQFHVVEAVDGLGALELMQQTAPDIVVTDLALPRMDGFELVQRMRADERLRNVPVIALSGFSGAEFETRARAVGSDVVLQKPCLPDELARAVELAARSRKDP
ncbi:MAG TPA: response regulator [Vicinamibacterales bacterium]|jgi:CheY-like chemotaxis protein|nr:response regulator [Vicinamibacterales bacterium]